MAEQRIVHGLTLDVATPAEVAAIVSRELDKRTGDDYTRRPGVVQLNAAGFGNASEDVSPRYNWVCERITIGGNGAPNALVQLFENDSNSTANLLEVVQVGVGGLYSDGFSNNIWVPANSQLVIAVSGGVAGGQVTYRLQIKRVKAV